MSLVFKLAKQKMVVVLVLIKMVVVIESWTSDFTWSSFIAVITSTAGNTIECDEVNHSSLDFVCITGKTNF